MALQLGHHPVKNSYITGVAVGWRAAVLGAADEPPPFSSVPVQATIPLSK
jgi:hypothetical protein